ncbi:hypothetical protein BDZ89DRAFT_293455 [Hymenopellis radicata]|nr:hypothetical protein BDZ89DRAFT_293455 [Hymenopellis radicata]
MRRIRLSQSFRRSVYRRLGMFIVFRGRFPSLFSHIHILTASNFQLLIRTFVYTFCEMVKYEKFNLSHGSISLLGNGHVPSRDVAPATISHCSGGGPDGSAYARALSRPYGIAFGTGPRRNGLCTFRTRNDRTFQSAITR